MKTRLIFLPLLTAFLCVTCKTAQKSAAGDDGMIDLVFLQLNDVYEISPSAGDNLGGLARVAALRKELLAKNPNTFTVLSGDFISPSVIGTLRYEGKRIRGRHMVETLNALGLDWVVFGNHEFDYDLEDLQARLNESSFTWLAGNARLKTAAGTEPFYKMKPGGGKEICPDHLTRTVKDADGTTVNLGLFGVLINSGNKPYVQYSDWTAAAQKSVAALDPQTDLIVGLTHLEIADDTLLARALPQVPLLMGGHDHNNMIHRVSGRTVAKADANARTAYVHTLRYNKKTGNSQVKSELRHIGAALPDEPATAAVIAKWEKIKDEALQTAGFNPNQKVTALEKPLDARDAFTRFQQAPVGQRITESMLAVAKQKPQVALLNSGSIRVDDVLSGTLTELDVVRMLPFGGAIFEVEMRGSLLRRTLEASEQNRSTGGYLQYLGLRRDGNAWLVGSAPLDDKAVYRVVLPEFLLTGNEINMGFLKTEPAASGTTNPDVLALYKPDPKDKNDLRNDIRRAVIAHLRGE